MKSISRAALILVPVFLLLAVGALAGEHPMKSPSGWFDFEKCAFCKHLAEDPGLLSHCTWETHPISNGIMTIMTIDPEYAESFARAEKAMNGLGMDIQSGKVNPMTLEMCGSCQAFGMLMMGGKVTNEEVHGEAAIVHLTVSKDAGVVERLHQMSERNTKEMAQMMGDGEAAGHGHDHGHDHHQGHKH